MNELEIIDLIRKMFQKRGFPLDDDVAYLPGGWAYKVDMLVRSTDVPKGMTPFQIGRKAVLASMSDVSVKGVRAKYIMLSFAFEEKTDDEFIKDLLLGIKSITEQYNLTLIGGDVNQSKDLSIDCILIGKYKKKVKRSGAKPGDDVYAVSEFGLTSLGLDYLLNGKEIKNEELRRLALKAVYEPDPKIELNLELIDTGLVTASMDSSDGLAFTLNEISEQSSVKIVLDDIPMSYELKELFRKEGRDPVNDALYGGEEYQMVFTFKKGGESVIKELEKKHGVKIHKIGKVTEGKGVYFSNGKIIEKKGWVFKF